MARERKSPQEKKLREYNDLVTPGNRLHAKARKQQKKSLSRETRNKADELLAQIKPQISPEDAEIVAGELTAAQLRRSVNPKRRLKYSAEPLSQVITRHNERRETSFGRKTRAHPHYDQRAREALDTLNSIEGKHFADVARRAGRLCSPEYRYKLSSELNPNNPLDRALGFVCSVASGSNEEIQALCRNDKLNKAFQTWLEKANRVLRKDWKARYKKIVEQEAIKERRRAARNK